MLLSALLASCATVGNTAPAGPAPASSPIAATSPEPACRAADSRAAPASPDVADALTAARKAPLLAVVARSGLASCRLTVDGSAVEVVYLDRSGSQFRFRRDSAIEGSEFEARFAAAPPDDPRQLLMQSELDAFGKSGCGIDWSQAGEVTSDAADGPRTTVYRGRACNCQGRIERARSGALLRLVFSSAC